MFAEQAALLIGIVVALWALIMLLDRVVTAWLFSRPNPQGEGYEEWKHYPLPDVALRYDAADAEGRDFGDETNAVS